MKLDKDLAALTEQAEQMLQQMSTCETVMKESNEKLEVRKAEFTEMKRELQEITDQEAKLKADLDEAGKNK